MDKISELFKRRYDKVHGDDYSESKAIAKRQLSSTLFSVISSLNDEITWRRIVALVRWYSGCYSTVGQKNCTIKAVEDGGTKLVYGAQDHAMVPRRERCHVRYEDSGGVSVLSRHRLVQKQFFGIRLQLEEVELAKKK